MVPAFRGSSPSGRDLNVIALRSRICSSSKLFILASATMMSSLLPSTVFAQNVVAAKPPLSPEAMALHLLAKRPVAKSAAKPIDGVESVTGEFVRGQLGTRSRSRTARSRRTRLRLVPGPGQYRHECTPFILRALAFHR